MEVQIYRTTPTTHDKRFAVPQSFIISAKSMQNVYEIKNHFLRSWFEDELFAYQNNARVSKGWMERKAFEISAKTATMASKYYYSNT